MYKFVRFKSNIDGKESPKWWLAADNSKMVIEHAKKYLKPTMQEAFNKSAISVMESMFKFGTPSLRPHSTDMVSSSIERVSSIKYEDSPLAFFHTTNDMMRDAIDNRLKRVSKGKTIYLEDGVREFGHTDNDPYYEIVEEVYAEEMKYPNEKNLTIDDVRYIQWDGGKHWYAKVGHYDIVDAHGNQKWDEKWQAEKAAEWYIENFC